MESEIIKIIFYFFVYSLLGWAMESIYLSIGQRRLVNTGFLYGPFCPIYGFGAVVLYVLLIHLQGKPVLIFLAGFFVLSVWEYFVGFLLEKLFKTKYWDYSNNKFNINGRVCLLNSIYWGFLSVFFIEIWNPLVETQLTKIPSDIILYIDIILVAYIVVDMILSSIKASNLSKRIKKLIQLGENLKEKLEELKKTSSEKQKVALQKIIDDLKLRQRVIRLKVDKQVHNLKKAFPSVQSEHIKEYLKLKVTELKNKTKE